MQAAALSAAPQNAPQLHSMRRAAQGCSSCCSRQVRNVFKLAGGHAIDHRHHHSASSFLDMGFCKQQLASQPCVHFATARQAHNNAPSLLLGMCLPALHSRSSGSTAAVQLRLTG